MQISEISEAPSCRPGLVRVIILGLGLANPNGPNPSPNPSPNPHELHAGRHYLLLTAYYLVGGLL